MLEKNQEPNLIVFAKQSFTALQKDIFTLAVMQLETGFNIQPDLFKNQTVTVSAKMLEQVTEKHGKRLREECRGMATKCIEVYKDDENWELIVPFPRIKYNKGMIELTMFSDVAQYFLELKKGYAEYYIRESLSLEQFNKKRLYELFSSYKKRNIPVWKVSDEDLKQSLGMEKDEYKGRPSQFEKQIIAVCVNAINEKTSITVDYKREKDGTRWFTVFNVSEKKTAKKEENKALDEKSRRLVKRLEEIGIVRKDLVKKIIEEHQTETWKWLSDNQGAIQAKKFTSNSGVLLVHLGIIAPKMKKT